MVLRALRAGQGARPDALVLVVAPETVDLAQRIESNIETITVVQDPPRGTGDAVKCALTALREVDGWLSSTATTPPNLRRSQAPQGCACVRGQGGDPDATLQDPGGYGRIVRDGNQRPVGIAERRDDDAAMRIGPTRSMPG